MVYIPLPLKHFDNYLMVNFKVLFNGIYTVKRGIDKMKIEMYIHPKCFALALKSIATFIEEWNIHKLEIILRDC